MDNYFITFIIPTIGRKSLNDSIKSLLEQTNTSWNALIIFDGIKCNINIDDNRIKILEIDKVGNSEKKNYAGYVRNIGIKHIIKNSELNNISEWFAFLDDDDYLSKDYIERLIEELNINNQIEICIFRMKYENGYILPTKYDKSIIKNKVGISFAIKKNVAQNIIFKNNPFEDYMFLKEAEINKYKILISSYVTYFIRSQPVQCDFFPKVLIN